MQTDATTPNIVAPTMLGVVPSVLEVVCKRMQQLPTLLGPTVHRGKDLKKPCVAPTMLEELCKRIQHCCATLRRSRNKRNVGSCWLKVWPVSDFAQEHPTTCNRVCKRTQHVTSNNVGSCWSTMLLPFARSLTHKNVACNDVTVSIWRHWLCRIMIKGQSNVQLQHKMDTLPNELLSVKLISIFASCLWSTRPIFCCKSPLERNHPSDIFSIGTYALQAWKVDQSGKYMTVLNKNLDLEGERIYVTNV